MERLTIPAMERSPFVDFDFATGVFVLSGESYPDDASRVFGPIFDALDRYLAGAAQQTVRFEIELIYFNSSSAKALMNMFKRLEQAAQQGRAIEINWRFAPDDDTMREFGEDFSEDVRHMTFNLVSIACS